MFIKAEERNGKKWIPGWGDDTAKVMIIASHPQPGDLHRGMILSEGDAAEEVGNALKAVGFTENDLWFTSMVKYGLGSKDKPTGTQIEECAEILDEEIATIKPKLIITLGAEVFKRVMKANTKQTDYVGEIIDSPYGKVMANFSPANIFLVDPTLRPEFVNNFITAKKYVDGKLKYDQYEYVVVDDPEENARLIKEYIDKGLWHVGYDAEWKGTFMTDEVMYSFQYSVEPHKAIVLPLVTDENRTTENKALLDTMKPMLEHPNVRRMGWNIRADDKRLTVRGFKLDTNTLAFDGMKAMALFDSRLPKGLETGIRKFTNYKPYYNSFNIVKKKLKIKNEDMSDVLFHDRKAFMDYAAGDAVSHRTACMTMMDEMKVSTAIPEKAKKYYHDVYLPISAYLMDMEVTGIPVDLELMSEITDQYNECYNMLSTKLNKLTREYGFNTEAFEQALKDTGKTDKELKAEGIWPNFNPRSFHDKRYFFFTKLGLEPAYYVKKSKARPRAWWIKQKPATQAQYNPSANGKSMASIRFQLADELSKDPDNEEIAKKYDVVKTYLDLARVSVFAKKFLSKKGVADQEAPAAEEEEFDVEEGDDEGGPIDPGKKLKSSYWAALCGDKRIHADFYECLDNFRSSSKPNVQNPASKVLSHIPKIFEQFQLAPPKNIRNIFYSGNKDWHFAEVDVAGADLAIAAFLSKDKKYIHDMLKGGFHTTKMREYFKDPTLNKDNASKYVTSKSITFRVAYTAGLMSAAMPIQAEIYAESGELVDIKLIEYALNTWNRYETYIDYRNECQRQVQEEKCIRNERGMTFLFEETDNPSIKAGWMNQALAYPIASELALFMYDISVNIKKRLEKDKIWMKWCYPVDIVHDANYWIIHKGLMKDNYFPEVCKHYFTDEIKIATGDNLGMEMVVADRWKGKEKVFSKETKWNFDKSIWEWDK